MLFNSATSPGKPFHDKNKKKKKANDLEKTDRYQLDPDPTAFLKKHHVSEITAPVSHLSNNSQASGIVGTDVKWLYSNKIHCIMYSNQSITQTLPS